MTIPLQFCYHGKLTSANHMKAPQIRGKRAVLVKTKEAKEDAGRIRELAQVAADIVHWRIPEAAIVEIIAWNSLLDVGNVEKIPLDSLKGIAWNDDRCVVKLTVEKRRDRGGERYEVEVSPAEPLSTPKWKQPSKKIRDAAARGYEVLPPEKTLTRDELCRDPHAFAEYVLDHTIRAKTNVTPPRSLKQLRSGDVLTIEERDALLKDLEV